MRSTLTARGKDGKQSKKIERNIRKGEFCAILLCLSWKILLMFALGSVGAQLRFGVCPRIFAGSESVIAGKPRSHRGWGVHKIGVHLKLSNRY